MTSTAPIKTTIREAHIAPQLRWAIGIGLGIPVFAILAHIAFWLGGTVKPSRHDVSTLPVSAATLAQLPATWGTSGLMGQWHEACKFNDTALLPFATPEGMATMTAATGLIAARGDARTLTIGELELADTAAAFLGEWNAFELKLDRTQGLRSDPTPMWLRNHKKGLAQAIRAVVILADRYRHPEDAPSSAVQAAPIDQPIPVSDAMPAADAPSTVENSQANMVADDTGAPSATPAVIDQDQLDARYNELRPAINKALARMLVPLFMGPDELRHRQAVDRIVARRNQSGHVTSDDLQALEHHLRALNLE